MSRHLRNSLGGLLVFVVLAALQLMLGGKLAVPNINLAGFAAGAPGGAPRYVPVPTRPLTLYTEPEAGITPVPSRITGAKHSIDLVMYQLTDSEVEKALAAAAGRGVSVRVLLNGGYYQKHEPGNESAYNYLNAHGVQVQYTPGTFALTHQKTLVVDGTEALIMTYNLTPKYYGTGRDFAVADTDASDVSAIEKTFEKDWSGGGSKAPAGDDLVWSPGSRDSLLSLIESATSTLQIYNEEIQDPGTISALAGAASRGVHVQLLMTDDPKWHTAYTTLTNAGGEVRTFAAKASLYIHAKVIIADGTQAFLGSENFSSTSLDKNRELGLFIGNPEVISSLQATFASDWDSATPYGTH